MTTHTPGFDDEPDYDDTPNLVAEPPHPINWNLLTANDLEQELLELNRWVDWLRRTRPDCPGIITATRGNHGQAQARAATRAGLRAVVYVPKGNSVEKNAAMRAFGAELREHGEDFDTAKDEAMRAAAAEGLFPVPPFHPELVRGVATYGLEFFRAAPPLDTVYVPIGCGSGICGVIAAPSVRMPGASPRMPTLVRCPSPKPRR